VRNQFLTPRYVVEFLTDNTLGRIWYEMRKGSTSLFERCRYLVRRPNEVFLEPGEESPADDGADPDLGQEELLKKPVYIGHRPKKDPRDIRVLDPACGSGHFLLYAFDLLETIYLEAWADELSPRSEVTGNRLREDFQEMAGLRREIPRLILGHNLHGIDIDPRAVQIAALALWMRAQRSWREIELKPSDRPLIVKTNIVCAEPMPGEEDMRHEFVERLRPRVLGQIVETVFEKMKLAGEAGSLLKIEDEIREAVEKAKKQWQEGPKPEQLSIPGLDRRPKQLEMRFDVRAITDERFWKGAEPLILDALKGYAEWAENGTSIRRRLFVEDAARGFAFIDLCRKRYDVVLMNPPFGEPSMMSRQYLYTRFKSAKIDVFAAFVNRGLEVGESVGAITSRTCFFLGGFEEWRRKITTGDKRLFVLADLGDGVLDAMVEAAAYCLIGNSQSIASFFRATETREKESVLLEGCASLTSGKRGENLFVAEFSSFNNIPKEPFAYWLSRRESELFRKLKGLEPNWGQVIRGPEVPDLFRATRCWWEIRPSSIGESQRWVWYAKGGEFRRFAHEIHLVVDYEGALMWSCPFRRPGELVPHGGSR
jgi:hypothetical protein